MFSNVFVSEQKVVLKRKLFWISIGALAALMVLIIVGAYVTYQSNSADMELNETIGALLWPDAPVAILGIAGQVGTLLVVILAGAMIAQAYSWRTLHLWLSHGTSRPVLLGAKFAALILPVVITVLVTLLVGGVVSGAITQQERGTLGLDQIDAAQLVLALFRTAYTLLPYAALAVLIAVVSRSAAGTIGAVVGYNLLIEGLMPISVLKYLPGGLATSVNGLNQAIVNTAATNAEAAAQLLAPAQAAAGLAVYTLAFLALAVWAFRRQDLTG
jgi:ABC-type transport system involved in multi-copper enzyme maturation permease subunit